MDMAQPAFKLRQLLREAIAELIRLEVLTQRSRFTSQNTLILVRSDRTLS
jgi:hypothetical protein